jgi:hypothetical protein
MEEKITDSTFLYKMLENLDKDCLEYDITPQYTNYRYDFDEPESGNDTDSDEG